MVDKWHLVWYITAALCLITGVSFALFAGRSVTPRHSVDAPDAVTQSVELAPRCSHHSEEDLSTVQPTVPLMTQDYVPPPRRPHHSVAAADRSTQEDLSTVQPSVPLMTQDYVPPPRYVDISTSPLDNDTVQDPSETELNTASQPDNSTHSQVISVV